MHPEEDPLTEAEASRVRVDAILLPDDEPLDGFAMRMAGQVIRALHA